MSNFRNFEFRNNCKQSFGIKPKQRNIAEHRNINRVKENSEK